MGLQSIGKCSIKGVQEKLSFSPRIFKTLQRLPRQCLAAIGRTQIDQPISFNRN